MSTVPRHPHSNHGHTTSHHADRSNGHTVRTNSRRYDNNAKLPTRGPIYESFSPMLQSVWQERDPSPPDRHLRDGPALPPRHPRERSSSAHPTKSSRDRSRSRSATRTKEHNKDDFRFTRLRDINVVAQSQHRRLKRMTDSFNEYKASVYILSPYITLYFSKWSTYSTCMYVCEIVYTA